MESFLRLLVPFLVERDQPALILSTGREREVEGTVAVEPIARAVRTELEYVRILRRKIRRALVSPPKNGIVLANAEHYAWPFLKGPQPVVLLSHGAVPPTLRRTRGRLRVFLFEAGIESRVIARVHRIITVNRDTASYYGTKFPEARGKIEVVPLGVDLDAFASRPRNPPEGRLDVPRERPWILSVGRISAEKNLPLLIEACERFRHRGNDAQLLIAGDGVRTGWLRREVARRPWVRWLGRLPRDDVLDLMATADVLAISSAYESGPLVLLEAIASGLPVVATPVGRAREFLDPPAIGQIAPANPEGFAAVLGDVLRWDRRVVRERAKAVAAGLNFRHSAQRLLEALQEV